MTLLLNASNLHVGGGIQVATSVIAELLGLPELSNELVVWASTEVDSNLRMLGYDITSLPAYEVVNSYGMHLLRSPLRHRLQGFDAVFTLFGPLYVWRLSGINITGFAQAWIIYRDKDIERGIALSQRLITRFKFLVQSVFFRKADRLVVELEHVRQGLLSKRIGSTSNIEVVHNTLSSVYSLPELWQPVHVPDLGDEIKLGFVGRCYLHKNTQILPAVVEILDRIHGIKARIYVTFTDEEFAGCDEQFRTSVINVGPLFVSQCPTFYDRMDAIIFPSLLESFSAMPLEAMAMTKPLFASDRPFNRDVCGDHAHYFDPLAPDTAARAIANVFAHGGPDPAALRAAREHAINFSNPKERAEKYLALLMQCAKQPNN